MRRRDLLASCGSMTFLATAGCLAPGSDEPGVTEYPPIDSVEDWPMFLYDATNRRCFSGDGALPGDATVWTRETGDMIWSSPVVADGRVFVGSYDRHLYALSADDGEVLWRYRTGDRIDGTPAVADGTVYVGSFDRNLYALDAETGEERWIYGNTGIVRSSPTVAGDTVYIGSHCRVEECTSYYDVRWPAVGYVLALDAASGDLRWRHAVEDGVLGKPAVAEERVYIGSSDGHLYALDAGSGTEAWRFDSPGSLVASPAYVDGRVVIGDLSGQVHAVDAADGAWLWQYNLPPSERTGQLAEELITSSPTVCGDTVYVGAISLSTELGTRGMLWAVSATDGAHRWAAGPFAEVVGSSPLVIDGDVYVGAHNLSMPGEQDPGLFVVDGDGATRWSFTVDGGTNRGFGSSPTVAGGRLFVGGADGNVYAFELASMATDAAAD